MTNFTVSIFLGLTTWFLTVLLIEYLIFISNNSSDHGNIPIDEHWHRNFPNSDSIFPNTHLQNISNSISPNFSPKDGDFPDFPGEVSPGFREATVKSVREQGMMRTLGDAVEVGMWDMVDVWVYIYIYIMYTCFFT